MSKLRRGDLAPRLVQPSAGPRNRRIAQRLLTYEAPGINTLDADGSTLVWEEARGCNVLDVDGNRYIDLTAGFGVAAIGHRHPAVVAAIRAQAGKLLHGLGDVHAHPLRADLARELILVAPVEDARVYFAVSGSDAVEIALKTALLATGRCGLLAFDPAYHGLSLGALQLTSRADFRAPFDAHFHSHVGRLPFGCPPAEIDSYLGRHPDTAAVIVEPFVGREGVLLPPAGWLRQLRELCHRHQVLLVADEIFTGFGRTGRWFAVEHEGIEPDLLCCGKALAGGLPIAAVIGRSDLMAAWRRPGEALHTATFVANPLACAAALAVLTTLRSERLPQRAARLGKSIRHRVEQWPGRIAAVVAVRGVGLMWGIELIDATVTHALVGELARRGLLVLAGGPQGRVLQLSPPLTITGHQLELALTGIEQALEQI